MSHRIIEKRRRDRMNNCLADLSQLIPASYLKQVTIRIATCMCTLCIRDWTVVDKKRSEEFLICQL